LRQRILQIPRFAWGLALAAVLVSTGLVAISAGAAGPPNLSKALEAQRRLVAERPQDAAAWNDLGNLLVLARQPAEAEAAYRKAVELDPKKASAVFNLGLLLQRQGNEGEAMKLYRRAVELEPGFAWAHFQLGTLYERHGDKGKAVHEYSQALALDPQLAFKEVNPQILDSKLMTESMLRAYRNGTSTTSAPQAYDDPSRIVHLMVPPPTPTQADAAEAAKAAAAPEAAQAGQRPTVLRQGDLPAGNAGQATQPGQSAAAARGVRTAPGLYAPAYPQGGNPQYPANPQGGVGIGGYGGYTTPGAAGTVPAEGGGRQWTRPDPRAPAARTDGAQPGTVFTPPPGSLYYRPGMGSTGQLGTRLGNVDGNG
jgi:tetratricopeptide (TPR) repeat protein